MADAEPDHRRRVAARGRGVPARAAGVLRRLALAVHMLRGRALPDRGRHRLTPAARIPRRRVVAARVRHWLASLTWDRHLAVAVARAGVTAVCAVALLTHVAWMWVGFHSQDGPAHLFAASAARRLLGGAGGTLARLYALNLEPDPNWITYPLLMSWSAWWTPRVAEMVLVTLLVVAVAAALYYAVTAHGQAGAPLAAAGSAVAVGWALHTGLYNFTASVALLLVVVGYYLRVCHLLTIARTLVLMALLVLLYFSHPLSLVAALLVLAVVGLSTTVADARAWRSWRLVRDRALALGCAVAPSLGLLGLFLATTEPVAGRDVPRDTWQSLLDVVSFRWPLAAVAHSDAAWAAGLACVTWAVVVALLVRRALRGDWSRWDALLAVPVVTGAAAVLLPDRMAGGTLVQPRLAIYMLLSLLLWVAIANVDVALGHWLGLVAGVVGTVVLCGLVAARIGPYREIQTAVGEVVTVAREIPSQGTVLGAVAARAPGLAVTEPLVHITDSVALAAGAVPVATLDAGSGYGPIRFEPRYDPDPALRGFPRYRTHSPDLTGEQFRNVVRQYNRVTGEPFDYVMLVAYDLRPIELEAFDDAGFRLLHTSEPTGLVRLYQVTSRVLGLRDAMQRHESPAAERSAPARPARGR